MTRLRRLGGMLSKIERWDLVEMGVLLVVGEYLYSTDARLD